MHSPSLWSRLARAIRPERTRRFDAAAGGRRWDARPSFGPIATETLAAAAPVRSRARYFANNNAWTANGVEALQVGLVGSGITPASQHPDPTTRAAIGAWWNKWTAICDLDGLTNFGGIQGTIVRGLPIDGESFLHMPMTADGLRLRVLPPELIDEAKTADLGNGACIIAGIEYDSAGRRVAYWILPTHPSDVFATSGPSVRVPADEVAHIFRPLGAGAVRGVSWLASALLKISELDSLDDALLVGFKTSAMFAGFLTDINATSSNQLFEGAANSAGILETGLEPGTLKVLPAGVDIRFSAPAQAQQAVEFAQLQLRAIAAGLGVPTYLLDGNLSNANYSSLRAGLVAFRQRLEAIQFNILVPQLLDPIYRRALSFAVLSGQLQADVGPDLFAVEWHPPGLPGIDAMKEVEADIAAINAGLMSRRQAVAQRGYSIEQLDAEIAADREREKELGLTFNTPAKTGADNAA